MKQFPPATLNIEHGCTYGDAKARQLFKTQFWITPAAAEGDEIAAKAVQVAILGHTDSKNRCPKKKSFEINASRATSPVVEQ